MVLRRLVIKILLKGIGLKNVTVVEAIFHVLKMHMKTGSTVYKRWPKKILKKKELCKKKQLNRSA